MTIKGKNFPDEGTLRVTFNGTEAEVITATETQIVAKAPRKAGVGPITVKSAKDSARTIDFNYEFTPVVTTIAGTGESGFKDGPGSEAQFYNPIGITRLEDGNRYVADFYNDRIRQITPEGYVETFIPPSQMFGRFTDIAISPDKTLMSLPSATKQVVFVGGFLLPHDILIWGNWGQKAIKTEILVRQNLMTLGPQPLNPMEVTAM